MKERYATEPVWFEACAGCSYDGALEWVRMYPARNEVLGPYCDGCMGWPQCSCDRRHRGPCARVDAVTADELWSALGEGRVELDDAYARALERAKGLQR